MYNTVHITALCLCPPGEFAGLHPAAPRSDGACDNLPAARAEHRTTAPSLSDLCGGICRPLEQQIMIECL